MNVYRMLLIALAAIVCCASPAAALDRPNVTFKVFQFPPNKIPRIDGKTDDWAIVPDDYVIGTDQFVDDSGKHPHPTRRIWMSRSASAGSRV